ncbi:hypothetical protein STEG23_030594 [Scotinomys teguina]
MLPMHYINGHKLEQYFFLNLLNFNDVAIDLIQEELGCIDSAERPLPGNEKLKNYTNQDYTGQYVSTKEIFINLDQSKNSWNVDMERKEFKEPARTWKQPRCQSTEEWVRKRWYIHTMEYYAADEIMKFAGKWMELENVILSKYDVTVEYFDVIMYYEDVLMQCYGAIMPYYDCPVPPLTLAPGILRPKLALSLFTTSHESICLAAGPTHPTPATSIVQYCDDKMQYYDVTVQYCDVIIQYKDVIMQLDGAIVQYYDANKL